MKTFSAWSRILVNCWVCLVISLSAGAQTNSLIVPVSQPYLSSLHADSAFNLLKEKMNAYIQEKDEVGQAHCLQQMGQLLFHLGSYTQAVDHLLQADKILRNQQPTWQAANLNILGTVYYYNQQPAQARSQFDEALDIYKKQNNESGIAETYGLIGHMFEKQLKYDSSYLFQRTALSYALSAGDTIVTAKIYENIGSIYEDKAMYDSAEYYFALSLRAYQHSGRVIEQIEVINNLGDVWSKRGRYDKGMVYARQAAALAILTGEKYQLQSAYRDIAQNFEGIKQYDSAYHYLEKSRQLVQSIYSLENSYQIGVLQTLYDTEKKNAQILSLNAARKANKVLSWASIIVLILIALLAAVVINHQKLKIRNEKAINLTRSKVYETEKGLMESELKRQQLEENSLKEQLDLKSRQLSSHLLHLIQKNEVMEELKQGLATIIRDDKRDQKKQVRQLLQKINISFTQDSYWEEFRLIFDKVHPSFVTSLQQKYTGLTAGEMRLMTLIKMNLSSGDMSTLLGITPDSLRVQRYRLKKKLNLGQDDSLTSFVQTVS
ncbi:MAG: tetratricopeptide repeat protein [Chitinophagaceae bacterium]